MEHEILQQLLKGQEQIFRELKKLEQWQQNFEQWQQQIKSEVVEMNTRILIKIENEHGDRLRSLYEAHLIHREANEKLRLRLSRETRKSLINLKASFQ